ncbi:MAG TPA: hypothetical protein VNG33_16355 [Polyangiaceae bacterium]|nr:hypothetical protein [Polyangiaceae bacterium]
MSARLGHLMAIFSLASGCAATPPAAAPDQFQMHVEGAFQPPLPKKSQGFTGAADVALGHAGCCDAGVFVAATSFGSDDAEDYRITQVLQGGVQLGVTLPVWDGRLRVRARVGKAGTAPEPPRFGRSGFATSAVMLLRLWDIEPPQTNEFKPNVDVFLGMSTVSMHAEMSSAGSLRDAPNDLIARPNAASLSALLIGIRIGTDYGIDLE